MGVTAITLAAGLGTRMKSARAKVLHELAGEPLIAHSVRSLAAMGADPIVVVVGHQAAEVEAAARRALPGFTGLLFARQERQLGTGHAARCAVERLSPQSGDDVLIAYADMPCLTPATLEQFIASHRASDAVLSLVTLKLDEPGAYGRVMRDRSGEVTAIVEARDATPEQLALREINTGVYLARASFLRSALAELRPDNAQGELYLTDLAVAARRRGLRVGTFSDVLSREFAGVNSREELARMEKELRQEINRRLMAAGVTFIDPASAFIAEQVRIGADSVIGPNVQILGASEIGAGVVIEGTAWLRDVRVGDGCRIKLGVRAEECTIGPASEIGPFAHLRTGTELAGHNRIGNFVETKQARLGNGSKASHLSYLGDVSIGADTNVGCGVITVNYDGYQKHRTEIGDRCMVGCDSQLIAPVRVGSDVFVASGTTILRDVPDGSLAFSHHPQRERAGWTREWRRRHGSENLADEVE